VRGFRLPILSAVAVAALAVGVAGCGSGGSSSTSSTTSTTTSANAPPGGSGAQKHNGGGGPGAPPVPRTKHPGPRHHHGPPGTTMKHTYTARIVGHGASQGGPIQPAELFPVTNSWRVSDHKNFTAVYAGADPQHHDTGRLVVFRQDFVHVKQTAHDVDVHGSGPVTITDAPTGRNAGSSVQQNGVLRFRGAKGVTGALHLSNDTVSVGSG
jgi:hypothetical protein